MASSHRAQQHLQGLGSTSPNSQISSCTTAVSSPLVSYHVPHYYVQSPRESSASTAAHEDAEKWRWSPYSSAPSSPLINLFYHTALGEPFRPANSRRVPPFSHAGPKSKGAYKWETVDEESEFPALDIDGGQKITRRVILFWCRIYVIGLLVMLAIAFMALWFACKPRGSLLAVQNVEFLDVELMHGSDRTQVPTDLLFVRSRVALQFHNPSKYFRMVFHPSILTFSYQGVPIAYGKVPGFHLHQEAKHLVKVHLDAQEAALYGAGIIFEASGNHVQALLTVSMDVQVTILWNLIRRKFLKDLICNFVLNTSTLTVQHLICN